MLESLKPVDLVEIFYEDTPFQLIREISPGVLVKGGDWSVEDIVGGDFVRQKGGEVFSLNFKYGHSTTNLIKKIQGNH